MKGFAAILAAAAFASACMPPTERARHLKDQAVKDFGAGDTAACLNRAGEAVKIVDEYWELQKAGDRHLRDPNAKGPLVREAAEPFHVLAHCLHASGRLPEAVANLERAVPLLALACQTPWSVDALAKGKTCKMAADDAETLAKWKKEGGAR